MLKLASNEIPEIKIRKPTHVVRSGYLAGAKVALITMDIRASGIFCSCEILEGLYRHRIITFSPDDLQELG